MLQVPFLHEIDLGPPLDLARTIGENKSSDVLRAVLQHLRHAAAAADRIGRVTPPEGRDPLEYRAFHAGAANALEEAFHTLRRSVNQ